MSTTSIRDLKRDEKTNTIINTNTSQYEKLLVERKKFKELQVIKQDLNNMKKDISKILEHLGLNNG